MRVVVAATARPLATMAVVAALAVVGAALALGLSPSASTSTLVEHSSASAQATDQLHRQFGDDSVIVMVQGDLERTLLTSDLGRLLRLEGCLSGNVGASGLAALPPACRAIARAHPAKVVYGPGTFANVAAGQIMQGLAQLYQQSASQSAAFARAARDAARKQGLSLQRQQQAEADAKRLSARDFYQTITRLALRYDIQSLPTIDNPQFVSRLFFDLGRGANVPKARFAYLVPSPQAALIQVRMRPDLTDAQRRQAIRLFGAAIAAPQFRLLNHQRYSLTGVPVVVDGLASAVQRSIFILLAAAALIMAATLMAVFRTRRRLRLLPLALALAAAAMSYGALALVGASLTMASIAALPVLIGLAVDYAVQIQSRFDERRALGERPLAAARAAGAGAGTIAGAALATAAGFLVLLLSPVPMVHGFALLVIGGIVLALGVTLTAGMAVLARLSERSPRPADLPPALPRARAALRRAHAWALAGPLRNVAGSARAALVALAVAIAAAWTFAAVSQAWLRAATLALVLAAFGALWLMPGGRAELAGWVRRRARRALSTAVTDPRRVLSIGLAVALLGVVADTQTPVVSDVRELVPPSLPALGDANRLEAATGVSGEIDVLLRGRDLTDPNAVRWMTSFQSSILARHGYRVGSTCRQRAHPPELCPALSLTDLFRGVPSGHAADVRQLLAAVPRYFSQAAISPDRRTAELAFGIRLMPLDRQQAVIEDIRAHLHPPAGISASVGGLPVLAADANTKLSSQWRRLLTLAAGLAAVFLVLLALRRRLELAAVPLIPIAMATGWSALVLFLLGIPLNPMSASLGALVIAISTEFSVLLSARYGEERRAGAGRERALEATYASTGAAVFASGATAIAGFGALMASDIRMLRDFGAVTVVDLAVSLAGVMIVLPAALVWAEQRGPLRARDLDPRRAWPVLRRVPRLAAEGLRSAAPRRGASGA